MEVFRVLQGKINRFQTVGLDRICNCLLGKIYLNIIGPSPIFSLFLKINIQDAKEIYTINKKIDEWDDRSPLPSILVDMIFPPVVQRITQVHSRESDIPFNSSRIFHSKSMDEEMPAKATSPYLQFMVMLYMKRLIQCPQRSL